MITRSQRQDVLRTLYTMSQNLGVLFDSLYKKDDELSKLENNKMYEECPLTPNERRLRIESLAYDIMSGQGVPFLDDIQRLTEEYFDEPIPREV